METEKSKKSESTKDDHVVVTIDPPTNTNPKPQLMRASSSLQRLNLSKPKSRFEENNYHKTTNVNLLKLTDTTSSSSSSSDDDEWYGNDNDKDNEDKHEDYEDYEKTKKMFRRRSKKKINKRAVIEWALFLSIMACLLCSLTLEPLKRKKKWSLEVWKWCLMIMVLFCGRLVAGWVVLLAVFLIERNFMLKEKVLYFVYGLRKSFRNCVWLGLVLVSWLIMFPDVNSHHSGALKKVFRFLVAVLVGATIWLLKIVLVKVLASSFHVATFFDRMKESVFNHYILEALSGPPLEEEEKEGPRRVRRERKPGGGDGAGAGTGVRGIDMEKLKRLSRQSRPTAWTVRRLVSFVRSSGLSTISRTVDDFGEAESEITSEWEARSCAKRTFKNVAKPAAK